MSDASREEVASQNTVPARAQVAWMAESAAAGEASASELATLEAHPDIWRDVLEELLEDTEEGLAAAQRISGPERAQVVADFDAERTRLVGALERFVLHDEGGTELLSSEPRLQTSWSAGRIVVWGGGPGLAPTPLEDLPVLIQGSGAPDDGWGAHRSIVLPSGAEAPALSLPVQEALGWLLEIGAQVTDGTAGASARWLGRIAVYAVQLVVQGNLVPTLQAHGRRDNGHTAYSVRWMPAQVDREVIAQLAKAMPGSVSAITPKAEPRDTAQDALAAMVHAFAAQSAATMSSTAEPPAIHSASDLVEAMVAHLDGQRFDAPTRLGSELTRKLTKWVAPTVGLTSTKLVIELQPPDDIGAWHLSVLGTDPDGHLVPVEVAIVDHPKLVEQLERVERLLPALKRPGAARRGQVILSQDEAWELMSTTGPTLAAVGFDVRVPALQSQAGHPLATTHRREHGRPGRRGSPARQRGLVGAVRRRRAVRTGDRRSLQAGTTARAVARAVDRARQGRPGGSRGGPGRTRRHHTAQWRRDPPAGPGPRGHEPRGRHRHRRGELGRRAPVRGPFHPRAPGRPS